MKQNKMAVALALLAFFGLFLTADLAVLAQGGPPDLPPTPLAIWTLDNGNWENLWHDPPLGFTNLNSVPSWEDTALSVDTNVAPVFLNVPAYGTNSTNISFDNGSIGFWCQVNWTSAADLGGGPGNWAVLLQVGRYSTNNLYGCWSLAVSPDGNTLSFVTQTNGAGAVQFQTSIAWNAGDWHYLVIAYCATNCSLFLEGNLVTNTPPIAYWPSDAECSNDGLWIGSDPSGTLQAHAQFQDLETYDVPLSTNFIQGNYAEVSAEIQRWGGSVPILGGLGGHFGDDVPSPGSGTLSSGSTPEFTNPTYTTNSDTAYADYANFWLTIAFTNSNTNVVVTVQNTLSNLTYAILTNSVLDPNLADWGVWKTMLATNSVIVAPPCNIGTNALFFAGQLVLITGTNQIADWWQMLYFNELGINPFADPDSDGLCNYSEYILGTNPTNAYSITTNHTDAQALFLAYTNDATTRLRLFLTNGPGTNAVTLTLSNTVVGSNYQIYSKNLAATNYPWRLETNFLSTNSATKITIALAGRSLGFIGGDGGDPDGDGLPSGYEVLATHTDPLLADTGNTGVPDGYKDPDGDSFVNLQEYYNGTDPLVFNAPPSLANLVSDYAGSGEVNYAWQPAGGPVVGYLISFWTNGSYRAVATNSPSQLSYLDGSSFATNQYAEVQTIYAGGLSAAGFAFAGSELTNYSTPCQIVNGPGGHRYLVASTNLPHLAAIRVTGLGASGAYPVNDGYLPQRYLQPQTSYPSFGGYGEAEVDFEIAVSSFTNGVAQVPDSDLPPGADYDLDFQAVAEDGKAGSVSDILEGYAMPFLDGTTQMKQNLAFLLRVGDENSFDYTLTAGSTSTTLLTPYEYAYSDFYFYDLNEYQVKWNFLGPFEDNYFYRNFVYDTNRIDGAGNLQTGLAASANFYSPYYAEYVPYYAEYYGSAAGLAYVFPTSNYLSYSNEAPIAGLLASTNTTWVGYHADDELSAFAAASPYSYKNLFGLAFSTLEVTLSNSVIGFETLAATNFPGSYSGDKGLPFYGGPVQPMLSTTGYYFARMGVDPQPGFVDYTFYTWSATPSLILGAVGQAQTIAGYEVQEVVNGGASAYLGQYFTNAFLMTNGVVTTNSAGIVSEYGQFLPTTPGQVALLTKPDPDQTNRQGTCELDIIRLSLDVNHDGVMDETLTGPDNTTSDRPFVFWANNDYDRWDYSTLDGWVEDDVQQSFNYPTADCNFTNSSGYRAIPCPRDLEDFARLWASGISNTLSRLPSGTIVTLNWTGAGSSPTIDVFQAADTNGGIGYLTNGATATNQLATNLYVGRLGPGQSLTLLQPVYDGYGSFVSNIWLGEHYIFCGVSNGSDQLNLTISDGGTVMAQSSQNIQILDIKQMYERWTVGDAPPAPPMTNAVLAEDNFSPGYPTTPFQYSYDPAYDTNDTYILYVHGWNMQSWEKDRFAETTYKRLYWQGYQGRFGNFRWPCNGFSLLFEGNYDYGEWTAWQSGRPFESLLARLNGQYPGKVYVLAHSMGNVVTGEALRLAGTNQIVNTYVASQAAISARAYDNTVPADITNTYAYLHTPDSEGHYYTNGAPPYFNGIAGAEFFVDFYNSEDWALNLWVNNQGRKPEPDYFSFTPTTSYPSGYSAYEGVWATNRSLLFGTNTYEIFAEAVQSYSFALGAETNVGGLFNTNLSVNLDVAPYNFGRLHVGHSLQFRSDNMTTAIYWQQLLSSFSIQP